MARICLARDGVPSCKFKAKNQILLLWLVGYSCISCKSAGDVERVTDPPASWVHSPLQPMERSTINLTSGTPARLESDRPVANLAQSLLGLVKDN
jgi:hypothetical protein